MKITETVVYESKTTWIEKGHGAVFVDKTENIEIVLEALIKQDDYWENYTELVKVFPENATISDISKKLEYTGKTDIYDIPKLVTDLKEKGIEIFIWTEYQD